MWFPPFLGVFCKKVKIFVFTGVFTIFYFYFLLFFVFSQISSFSRFPGVLFVFSLVYTNILKQNRFAGQV